MIPNALKALHNDVLIRPVKKARFHARAI